MAKQDKKYTQTHRNKRRQWLFEYKKTLSCVYCGESNPLCLDMDHIDRTTKRRNIITNRGPSGNATVTPATMVTGGYKWDDVLAELAKCQPVCSNCHRIKTILEANKMQGCDIEEFIPANMIHLRPNSITE